MIKLIMFYFVLVNAAEPHIPTVDNNRPVVEGNALWLQQYGLMPTSKVAALLAGDLDESTLTPYQRQALMEQVFRMHDRWEERCLSKAARRNRYEQAIQDFLFTRGKIRKIVDAAVDRKVERNRKEKSFLFRTSPRHFAEETRLPFDHVLNAISLDNSALESWSERGSSALKTSSAECEFEKRQIDILMERVPSDIPRQLAWLLHQSTTLYGKNEMNQDDLARAIFQIPPQEMAKLMEEQKTRDQARLKQAKVNAAVLKELEKDPEQRQALFNHLAKQIELQKQALLKSLPPELRAKVDAGYHFEINFDPDFDRNGRVAFKIVPTWELEAFQWGQSLGSVTGISTSPSGKDVRVEGKFQPPRDSKASLDQMHRLSQMGVASAPFGGLVHRYGHSGGLINTYPEQVVALGALGIGRSLVVNGIVHTVKMAALDAGGALALDAVFQGLSGIDDAIFHGKSFTWDWERSGNAMMMGALAGPIIKGSPKVMGTGGVTIGGVGAYQDLAQGRPITALGEMVRGGVSVKIMKGGSKIPSSIATATETAIEPSAPSAPQVKPEIRPVLTAPAPSRPILEPRLGPKSDPKLNPRASGKFEPKSGPTSRWK